MLKRHRELEAVIQGLDINLEEVVRAEGLYKAVPAICSSLEIMESRNCDCYIHWTKNGIELALILENSYDFVVHLKSIIKGRRKWLKKTI